jgi:hypothetical protein
MRPRLLSRLLQRSALQRTQQCQRRHSDRWQTAAPEPALVPSKLTAHAHQAQGCPSKQQTCLSALQHHKCVCRARAPQLDASTGSKPKRFFLCAPHSGLWRCLQRADGCENDGTVTVQHIELKVAHTRIHDLGIALQQIVRLWPMEQAQAEHRSSTSFQVAEV